MARKAVCISAVPVPQTDTGRRDEYSKANEIARQLKKSTDRSSKLSEIERNLRKEGFDIDSIPMDRDQPWKESRESYLKEQEVKEENDHE